MAPRAQPARPAAAGAASNGLVFWLVVAAIVVVADQLTKVAIVGAFSLGDVRPVTEWFNLVRAHNPGAAFSFLAGAGGWQRWFFTGIGIAASIFIVWLIRSHPNERLFCLAVSLILGGAVGNVIDRLWHGHVIDFLQFRFSILEPVFSGGYFPSFNVADSAITLGAILLIVDEIRRVMASRR